MEFLAKPFDNLGGKLRVKRVHLARLARGKMDDQKRYDRDKKECDDLLNNASTDK